MQVGGEDIDALGIQEVARQLGVHEQTLRRWIWRGKVKATRSQVGRSYRWLVSPDPGLPIPDERLAQVQTLEPEPQADGLGPSEFPDSRSAASQRERLAVIEEQIEKEIRRLNAEAAVLQAEIGRLSHTLGVLRSDVEA